ncbi:MAG: hypothetical protein ABIW80_11380 [Lapillicoccus sp.]
MDNTMTTTGAVEMTGAYARVWSECLQPLSRRLAVVPAPVKGSTLPILGLGHRVQAVQGIDALPAKPRFTGTTDNYMDVTPFRTRRPPV